MLVFESMGFKPTLRQLELLVFIRITLGTALLYSSAFVPHLNSPAIAVPALAAYGFFGGLTITWGSKIAGEVSDCCDTNVEAARVCVLWQSAGLSIGASFSGAFAAGYECLTESFQLTEALVLSGRAGMLTSTTVRQYDLPQHASVLNRATSQHNWTLAHLLRIPSPLPPGFSLALVTWLVVVWRFVAR